MLAEDEPVEGEATAAVTGPLLSNKLVDVEWRRNRTEFLFAKLMPP